MLSCFPGVVGSEPSPRPNFIRVALYKGLDSLKLDGKGVLLTDGNGEPLRVELPLVVKRSKEGLSVNGMSMKVLIATAPVSVSINGKGYRGLVEVSAAERGLLAINELPLEDYLVGLINCEISSQWPMEAIKAQAVIARSYAMYQKEIRKNSPYHLESSVADQVYDGCDLEDSRATRGVRETVSEVLTYNGTIIQAFYHSNCGGHTEASENVWGAAFPYLQGVECKYCTEATKVKWEQTLSLTKIESLLKAAGFQVAGLKDVKAGRRNRSNRLNDLTLTTSRGRVVISAVNFRKAIGYGIVKSTNFEIRTDGSDLNMTGAGYGHGVGLCQWGSKQRAGDGFDYREILGYYYPGTTLQRMGK